MNEEAMKKHYEKTPKDILINILISSREQVEKLQNRNKERKQEIERLNNKLKDIKSQLDYLETYSNEEDVFEDMKRRLDRIESIVNREL